MRERQPRSAKTKRIATLQLPLVEMIQRKLIDERCSLSAFAERHNVSYSMLTSVMNSTRWVAHSDKDTVVRPLARILGVPVVTIYIKAGLLDHQDFALTETLETRLSEAYDAMAGDQTLMAVLPPNKETFMQWPTEARSAIALLYQTFTRKELLDMVTIEQTIVREGRGDDGAGDRRRDAQERTTVEGDAATPAAVPASKRTVKPRAVTKTPKAVTASKAKPLKPDEKAVQVAPLSIRGVTSWKNR